MSFVTISAVVCILLFSSKSLGDKRVRIHVGEGRVRDVDVSDVDTHEIIRKQSETCRPYSTEYFDRRDALECNPTYVQAIHEKSNYWSSLMFIYDDDDEGLPPFQDCGTNHLGILCKDSVSFANENASMINAVGKSCFTTGELHRPPSSKTCSDSCKNVLRDVAEQMGCCIHSLVDEDSTQFNMKSILRIPLLWENCGVAQPAVCSDTPPILEKPAPLAHDCNVRLYYYFYCKYLGAEYRRINRECGVDDEELFENCAFDKGDFCQNFNFPELYILNIYNRCYSFFSDDNVCVDECKESLQEFKDTYGCCINYSLNYTDPPLKLNTYLTRADLWAACGIETPMFCNSLSPPDSFLDCAHGTVLECASDNGTAEVNNGTTEVNNGTTEVNSGTAEVNVYNSVLIMSALVAPMYMIMYNIQC